MDNLCRLQIIHGILITNVLSWAFLAVAAHFSLIIPAMSCAIAGILIEPVMRSERWSDEEGRN